MTLGANPHTRRSLNRRIRTAALRLVGAVLLVSLPVQAQSAAPAEPAPGVRALLVEFEEERGVDEERLLELLLAAGPLVERSFLDYVALPAGERALSLDAALEDALHARLLRLPRVVAERLEAPEAAGRRECLLALSVLERFGGALDVPLLFELASPPDPELPFDSRLALQLEHSLAAVLSRDEDAWEVLTARFATLDERVTLVALRAVSEAASPRAMTFLGERLGKRSSRDAVLLAQLGKVVERFPGLPDERTLGHVHEALSSIDPAVRREACLVVGRLEDTGSTPELIELLADEDPVVAGNARWALQRVTLESLGTDQDRWRLWYEREATWWRSGANDVIAALHGEDEAAVAGALRAVVGHRLHRHELAVEVAHELRHPNQAIVAQACAVLGVLRSRRVIPELEELLESGSEAVRPHAQAALTRLRG